MRPRILFVNMPLRESALPNNIPLGPALLAARLLYDGADVGICDLNRHRPWLQTDEEVRKDLLSHALRHLSGWPDAVLMSGKITTLRWQERVARIARSMWPRTMIVSGGGLATDLYKHLSEWIPEIDAVGVRDGDNVISQIAKDAVEKKWPREGPLFIYTGARPDDLDAIPFPAWDLCALDVYLPNPIWGAAANNSSETPFTMERSLNTVSSRGCPFACRFCHTATFGRNYGVRSAEDVANEIIEARRAYGIDFMGLTDDNAMVLRDRLKAMADLFPKAIKGVRWGTHGRMDEASDLDAKGKQVTPRRVEWMAEAGCVYIGFGAESAHPTTLARMDKGKRILSPGMENVPGWGEFPKTMVRALEHCRDVGIHANTTWIMGYPGETLEHLKTTVRFMLMMEDRGLVYANNRSLFVATAYPGTELWKEPVVQERVRAGFGGSPEDFKGYVEQLDDATKLIDGRDGRPMNFSAMDDATFLKAREAVESGDLEGVLAL